MKKHRYIRYHIAELAAAMEESPGNISNYYNGKKPISPKFHEKFQKIYQDELNAINAGGGNKITKQPRTKKNSYTTSSAQPLNLLAEPEQQYFFDQASFKKLEDKVSTIQAEQAKDRNERAEDRKMIRKIFEMLEKMHSAGK